MEERKAIVAHEAKVRELGCIVTGSRWRVTLHHCHGGSMNEVGVHVGMGQKASNWLQIPLTQSLHVLDGMGIDAGVITLVEWEKIYGTQVELLKEVSRRLGYNVFEKAGIIGAEYE
jgi:hypothetical protein